MTMISATTMSVIIETLPSPSSPASFLSRSSTSSNSSSSSSPSVVSVVPIGDFERVLKKESAKRRNHYMSFGKVITLVVTVVLFCMWILFSSLATVREPTFFQITNTSSGKTMGLLVTPNDPEEQDFNRMQVSGGQCSAPQPQHQHQHQHQQCGGQQQHQQCGGWGQQQQQQQCGTPQPAITCQAHAAAGGGPIYTQPQVPAVGSSGSCGPTPNLEAAFVAAMQA